MNREKGDCGKNNQCPVLPTFLFKVLLVQHHLVEGGFGEEVMNKAAGLEFSAVLRAHCERTELICKDCEQLDCNAATGLGYFLQKEKFPQKGRETSLVEVRPADNICHMQTPAPQLASARKIQGLEQEPDRQGSGSISGSCSRWLGDLGQVPSLPCVPVCNGMWRVCGFCKTL